MSGTLRDGCSLPKYIYSNTFHVAGDNEDNQGDRLFKPTRQFRKSHGQDAGLMCESVRTPLAWVFLGQPPSAVGANFSLESVTEE